MVCRSVLQHVHVPSMSQALRQRAFEVLFELTTTPPQQQEGATGRMDDMAEELLR